MKRRKIAVITARAEDNVAGKISDELIEKNRCSRTRQVQRTS